MAGILTIEKGSPNWWLSKSIFVTPVGDPTTPPGTGNPIATDTYNVSVIVNDLYPDPVDSGWNLFVCWAIPTVGPIPVPPASQTLNNAPVPPVGAMSFVQVETADTWTPVFENGGHECLVAVAYNEQAIGGLPVTTLDGNAPSTDVFSIAQKNLGVVQLKKGKRVPFHYAFQVCNGAPEHQRFAIAARQAPLSDIEAFLPGMPGGKSILHKPGKIEQIGIAPASKHDSAGQKTAAAIHSSVEIAPRSCHPFTLSGVLEEGNALIHVTQTLDERVVGGLSVLVMAEG
jgi:hypothetical protein